MKILYQNDDGAGGGGGGGDGDGATWDQALPESVQSWDEVKNSDSPEKFWDQMTNMRSFIGQSIRIPGENASAEDQKAFQEKLLSKVPGLIPTPNYEDTDSTNQFYNALGRPDDFEKYTMPEIDDKGVKLDMAPAEAFRPIAHKNGLTQKQYEGIIADMTQQNIETSIKDHAEAKEQDIALKNEWGLAYDGNLKKVGTVAKLTGAPVALQDAISTGKLDTASAKWLLGIANSFKSEGVNLNEDKSGGVLTPVEARKQITEIMNNKEHAYWSPGKVGHDAAKKQMRELYKMAEPKGQSTTLNTGTVGAGGSVQFK